MLGRGAAPGDSLCGEERQERMGMLPPPRWMESSRHNLSVSDSVCLTSTGTEAPRVVRARGPTAVAVSHGVSPSGYGNPDNINTNDEAVERPKKPHGETKT